MNICSINLLVSLLIFVDFVHALNRWKVQISEESVKNIGPDLQCIFFRMTSVVNLPAERYEFKISLRDVDSFEGTNGGSWKYLSQSEKKVSVSITKNEFVPPKGSTVVSACFKNSDGSPVQFDASAQFFAKGDSDLIDQGTGMMLILATPTTTRRTTTTTRRSTTTTSRRSTTTTRRATTTTTRRSTTTTSRSTSRLSSTLRPTSTSRTTTRSASVSLTPTPRPSVTTSRPPSSLTSTRAANATISSSLRPTSTTSSSIPPTPTAPVNVTSIEQKLASGKLLVGYWGQMGSGFEKPLATYCDSDEYDVIIVSFLHRFIHGATVPIALNLAGHCNTFFPAQPELLNCPNVGRDILYCQSKGKKIMLSVGGAISQVGFATLGQVLPVVQTIWDLFLGGSSAFRPFGSNVTLDGIDLDIESGSPLYYDSLMNGLKSLMDQQSNSTLVSGRKKYYLTGAPQCFMPDILQSTAWKNGYVDWLNIQFYNNWCGLQNYDNKDAWNYGSWANWRDTVSVNTNAKLLIGAPGSSSAAGSGFVPITRLSQIINETKSLYPRHFGGVMLWDLGSSGSQTPSYSSQVRRSL